MRYKNNKPTIDKLRSKGLRPIAKAALIYDKKVLFVYKKDFNLWQLPQGGIQNQENPKDALKREIKEEIGKSIVLNTKQQPEFIGFNKITFPREKYGCRALKQDNGTEVEMKGKAYFIYAQRINNKMINLKYSEFQEYKWCSYQQGKTLCQKIYQKNKKNMTLNVLEVLREKKYIR